MSDFFKQVTEADARIAELTRERDEARAAWRCFHCGFETTDRAEAAGHFGDRDDEHAICVTWNSLNADGKLAEWQATWGQLLELQGENSRLRQKIEGLEYLLGSQEADIAQKFKGARSLTEAWQKFDSLEGRALAAEQQRDEARAQAARLREALNDAQKWAARWASLTEHRDPNKNTSGPYQQHPHGYAICPIPDWEVKQKRDDYAATLVETPEQALAAITAPYEAKIERLREALMLAKDAACHCDAMIGFTCGICDGSGQYGLPIAIALTETPTASLEAITGPLNARIAELEAACGRALDLNNKQHEDSNIAHRWFATHFGELMNGRDFSVKCPMATQAFEAVRAEALTELKEETLHFVNARPHNTVKARQMGVAFPAELSGALDRIRAEAGRERELAAWDEALTIATQQTMTLNETPGSQMAAAGAGLVMCAIGKRRDEIAKEGK